MDAKPQRLSRALKVRDENMPPPAAQGKTLHHARHKSSPALSTVAQNGAMKAAPKRTVFGDVSNTAQPLQTIQGGVALNVKSNNLAVKEKSTQEATKTAALQRPAQRPISVTGLRGFFNNLTSNNSSAGAPKPPVQDAVSTAQPILQKKQTIVFRETDGPIAAVAPEKADMRKPAMRRNTTSLAGHEQSAIADQILTELTSSPRRPTSSDSAFHDAPAEPVSAVEDINAPLPAIDALEAPKDAEEQKETADAIACIAGESLSLDSATVPAAQEHDAVLISKSTTTRRSGASENWDYAYDEYEDEGYTTVRSIKTRGDYTTGHSTVVLAPRMTARVEQELADAEVAVASARSTADLEEDEIWDTSMVAEYGREIFEYMRALEMRMLPNAYYMDNQTEVQWSMRSLLIDWLVQVHHRFSLLPETLFLTVNYIDRFLSCKVVSLLKLQLVGATAIFVAAKYEEINCPSVQEIVYMVDNHYGVDEILKAERFMLSMLQFELGWPGPMSFLRRISKADDYDLETRTLAKYFLEVTIMDERFVGSPPSYTAAAAHCLARLILKKGGWTQKHVYYSGYTYSQLQSCLITLLSCCEDPEKHHGAVYDKYTDKRFKRASVYVRDQMIMGFRLPRNPRPSQVEGLGEDWSQVQQPSTTQHALAAA